MTDSPSLAAKRIKGALHLVLRAGSDPAARGKGPPVPRAETEHDRERHEQPACSPDPMAPSERRGDWTA
jgi:hypothetical protein